MAYTFSRSRAAHRRSSDLGADGGGGRGVEPGDMDVGGVDLAREVARAHVDREHVCARRVRADLRAPAQRSRSSLPPLSGQ
eukprot:3602978-Rhodomonas_salina.2